MNAEQYWEIAAKISTADKLRARIKKLESACDQSRLDMSDEFRITLGEWKCSS